MTFLKNTWYVAAWASELAPKSMLPRTICNEGVVFFRDAAGRAVALEDRCPHRFAPLSRGVLANGKVACGYHGLVFDRSGACVLNPHGEGHVPPNARARAYPVEERHDALWIWMGDPAKADNTLIPDFSMVIDPETTIVRGYLHAPAHYELMVDNLLDLGHTAYLHPTSLGSEAIVRSTRGARRDGDTVVYELWAPDGEAPPVSQLMMPWYAGKQVDHWMVSTWHAPGLIHQLTGTAIAGTQKQGGDISNGLHWLTPETDKTTHYFQALSRNFRLDDPQLDGMIEMGVKQAFTQEDFPMVGAIQQEIGDADIEDLSPVILSIDAGAVLARRILRQKVVAEAGVSQTVS